MSTTPRCQGCDLAEGEPRRTWHNRRNPASGGWDRICKVGKVCVLRPLDLGGTGERLFCQHCWNLAVFENARLQHPLLGRKKKNEDRQPDPRQLRFV